MVRAIIGIAMVSLFIFLVDRFCKFAIKWEKEQRERDEEALVDAGRSPEEIRKIMDGNGSDQDKIVSAGRFCCSDPDESRMGLLS